MNVDNENEYNGAEQVLKSWNSRIKVLSNPSAWRGISMAFGIGSAFLAVLFSFISKSPDAKPSS